MSEYLIDSDWIIDVLNDQTTAIQTLEDLTAYGLAVSLETYGELYEGAYYGRDPEASIAGVAKVLEDIEILAITTTIIERFAIVRGGLPRQLRHQIGDMDILIASTALVNNLTLVTRNTRDFQHIPGLKIFEPDTAD